ncbi:MAG: flippase [Ktedonobacterales bacterium]|nr:flippase [Ktedonobacterales bacterium]
MRVLKNIIALLVSQLGTWTISLVLTLIVPSYLGPDRYGLYSFVGSFVGFFALGMQLGTSTYLTWRIAREPEVAPRLLFNTLLVQIPLAIVCGIVALVVLPALDPSPFVRELVLVLLVTQALTALTATCVGTLAGFQIMRIPAFVNLFSVAVSAVLLLISISFHAGLDVFVATALIGQVLGFLVILTYTLRKIHLLPQIDPTLWRAIIFGGLPFFSWSLVLLFYSQISVSMLKIIAGNTVVGWYGAANRIVGIPVFLPSIVIIAILPALSQERTADSPRFRELASRSLRLVALIGIPAAVGMVMLASQLTALLRFPSSFAQVGPIIAILAINIPLVAIDMVLGTVLIALGRQKAWACVGIIAALVNPGANLWAIPYTQRVYGNGAIGAAGVMVLTELVMFAGAMILRPRAIFTRWDVWYIVRCLFAAGVMVPAVLALAQTTSISTVSAVGYGMLVYAMAAYTLQVVRNEDLRGLFNLVAGRMGLGALRGADDRQAYDAVATHIRATDGGGLTNPALSTVTGSMVALRARSRSSVGSAGTRGAWSLNLGAGGIQAIEPLDDGWITIIYEDTSVYSEPSSVPSPPRGASAPSVPAGVSASQHRQRHLPTEPR